MLHKKQDRYSLAVLYMLFALFLFTIVDTIAKLLVQAGYDVTQVVFMRYFMHFLFVLLFLMLQGNMVQSIKMRSPYWVILRSLLLVSMTGLNFWALMYIPIATTGAIMLSIPILVCIFAALFFKEHIGIYRITAVIFGLVGALIIIRPFSVNFHWAMFASFSMAVCCALFNIVTRKIAGSETSEAIQFSSALVGVCLLLPIQFFAFTMPDGWIIWLGFIMIGFVGWVSHHALILAHHYAEASSIAPLNYVQFIFMVLSSWLIFNEIPDYYVFLGGMIILISGIIIWWREKQKTLRRL